MEIIPLVGLKRQNKALEKKLNKAIGNTLNSSKFILGPQTRKFEENLARACGAKYCVSLSSGTAALELSLKAVGVKSGDEVITVPFTFIANAEAIVSVGARPVFCEIDKHTFTLDTNKLKNLITKKTKAIIPVDLYGQPCDLDPIIELSLKKNIAVIEDACQAIGAEYKGRKVGSIANATAFSFYPGKNIGALGDAGALTTNDFEMYNKIKALRDHGRLENQKYVHSFIGGNYRMDEIQASVLNVKLKYLQRWSDARRKIALQYRKNISSKFVVHPEEPGYAKSVYHIYAIQTKKREQLRNFLKSKGILTGVHYPLPLHLQPALKFLGYKSGDFKVSEECAETVLSLPIYPELRKEEINFISSAVNEFFSKKR